MARNLVAKIEIVGEDKASAEIKKVSGSLEGLGSSLAGQLAKWGSLAGVIATAAEALGAVAADTDAADSALGRLNRALGVTGDAAGAVGDRARAFASALQDSSGISRSQVLELEALAVAYTNSASAAEKLTAAAVDFAAGVGISQEEAVRKLGASLSGGVDELARFDSGLRDLSASALASGEAIDRIAQKFSGAASENVKTLSGSVHLLGQELLQLADTIGIDEIFRKIAEGARLAAAGVNEASDQFVAFREAVTSTGTFAQVLSVLGDIFNSNTLRQQAQTLATQQYTEAQASATAAAQARAAAEAQLAANEAARVEEQRIALLKEFGLAADGTLLKVQQLSDRLVLLDQTFSGGAEHSKAFAAAQSQIVSELVAQAGGLERLEQLYRDGLISAEAWNQALLAASQTSVVLATNIGRTSDGLERQTDIVDTQTGALLRLAEAAAIAGQGMVSLGEASGASFDEIARAQGRGAAVDEAIQQGGRLVLGGTRVIIPRSMGGGSRIVRSPGLANALHGGR